MNASDRSIEAAAEPLAVSAAARRKGPEGGSTGVITGGESIRNCIQGSMERVAAGARNICPALIGRNAAPCDRFSRREAVRIMFDPLETGVRLPLPRHLTGGDPDDLTCSSFHCS